MFDFGKKKPSAGEESRATGQAAAAAPPAVGLFARLRARLNRPDSFLSRDIRDLLPGRQIDAELLDDLETRLLSADVGVEATERILGDLRRRVARHELSDMDALLEALGASITAILQPVAVPLRVDPTQRPFVVLVVGVNGSGKTTSIGKLAYRLKEQGKSVLLAAGDTFRAAAVEQLEVWGTRNQVQVISQAAGADPAAVIFDALSAAKARGIDVLLADTAGRLQNQSHLMDELRKVKRVLARIDASAPHEVLLVLDGSQGQNALQQALLFNKALGVSGIVLTKLDGTAKGGIVVAIAAELRIPIRFVGVGEDIADFDEFDVADFVTALIGPARGAASP